jgi:DNA-binding IclR family transcriptional regulator
MVTTSREPATSSTRTVERALALLATVCTNDITSLAAASRSTGVPASTALRLLRTLEREQFVVRDEDAGWRAGPRLLQLAVRSLAREPLARLARPSLARLTAATGESSYLSVRGSDGLAVHVAAYDGTHPVRYAAWVGHTVSLDGSAIGAALSGDPGDLTSAGYASAHPAGEPDVTQVSAPIHRPGGVVAALSVVGPSYRLDEAAVERLGEVVVAEAQRLEVAMGVEDAPLDAQPDPRPEDHMSSSNQRQERAVAG